VYPIVSGCAVDRRRVIGGHHREPGGVLQPRAELGRRGGGLRLIPVVHQVAARAPCRFDEEPVAECAGVGVRIDRHHRIVVVFGQVERKQRRDGGLADTALDRHDGHRLRREERGRQATEAAAVNLLGRGQPGFHQPLVAP